MTDDFFPEARPARPIWLVTLADLALLLVGFFVLVQANQTIDRRALAQGLREGFGNMAGVADPMPVAIATVGDFAPGSSVMPASPAATIAWARGATGDPRVRLRISGAVDGAPRTGNCRADHPLAAGRDARRGHRGGGVHRGRRSVVPDPEGATDRLPAHSGRPAYAGGVHAGLCGAAQ